MSQCSLPRWRLRRFSAAWTSSMPCPEARATLLRWTWLAMTSPGMISVRKRRRRESVKGVASRRAKVYSRWRAQVEKVRGAIDGPPFAWEDATSYERRLFFSCCQVPDTGGTPVAHDLTCAGVTPLLIA